MKISKMELKNWCQFDGVNTFDFSESPDGNIIVIYGGGAAGKTVLVRGIYWCLFGLVHDHPPDCEYPLYSMRSFERASEGEDIKICVSITFTHNGETYCTERSFEVQKKGDEAIHSGHVFSVKKKMADGKLMDVPHTEMDEILSHFMFSLFLAGLERIDHMIDGGVLPAGHRRMRTLTLITEAARQLMHPIPLILDTPFTILTLEQREKAMAILSSHSGQIILLMPPYGHDLPPPGRPLPSPRGDLQAFSVCDKG